MSKKCVLTISFVLSLAVQSHVAFGECTRDSTYWWGSQHQWRNITGNDRWEDPCNWEPNTVPDCNSDAVTLPVPQGPNIIDERATNCLDIYAWSWAGAEADWGATETNVINCAVDAGTRIAISGRANLGTTGGHGVLNVYGGTITTPAALAAFDRQIGNPPPVPVNGGDFNGLWVGGGEVKTLANTWGVLNIYDGGLVSVQRIAIYNGYVNIYEGGTLEGLHDVNVNRPDFYIGDALVGATVLNRINLRGGKLILQGDWTNIVADYNSAGKIVSYDFRGEPNWNYNITNPGKTTVIGKPNFGPAWNPVPIDGAGEINSTPVLSWSPGAYNPAYPDYNTDPNDNKGGKHHLYFGTSFSEVYEANESNTAYVGEFIDQNTYDVCSWHGDLTYNLTYYWRVDEFNDANFDSPWHSRIWRFTTMTGIAHEPYPDNNNTTGFDVNRLYLGWQKGLWAAENDGNGHNVYLGTSFSDVNTATTATAGIFKGNRSTSKFYLDPNEINLPPGYFVEGRKYYWRIDEFNSTHAPEKSWKGRIWNFTFPLTFMVEDFNSYTSTDNFDAIWHRNLPEDGKGLCATIYDSTGATISWDGAAKNMIFDYNNRSGAADIGGSALFSEARMEFNTTGVDWKAGSVPDTQDPNILIISYMARDNGNSADPVYDRMYVALIDASGTMGPIVYNPDLASNRHTYWQDWMIRFSDLKGATALDFTHDVNLLIGFGLRCNPQWVFGGIPGGLGMVRFDNIRVSKPFCNPLLGQPSADFSGNCEVNMVDLDLFINDWMLKTEVNSFPDANEPCVAPLLWYKFEEVAGGIADNSGSLGTPGDANVELNDVSYSYFNPWDAGGRIGRCINLRYGSNQWVNIPSAVLADYATTAKTAFTYCCWIAYDHNYPFDNWNGLFSVAKGTNELIENECPTQILNTTTFTTDIPRARLRATAPAVDISTNRKISDFAIRWNHYAFVLDCDNDVAKIYENGYVIATSTGGAISPPILSDVPSRVAIGSRSGGNWGNWYGKIDDFRFYDRGLDANQIAWIATNGTKSITVPLVERTNLKTGDATEIINFRDYSVLADQWLDAPVLMQ